MAIRSADETRALSFTHYTACPITSTTLTQRSQRQHCSCVFGRSHASCHADTHVRLARSGTFRG
eukprot:3479494-Prymnesium_polylepis.1